MSVILDVLKSIRRGDKGTLYCPICREMVRRSRAPLEGWILPVRYICQRCGYSGFLAVENKPDDFSQQ